MKLIPLRCNYYVYWRNSSTFRLSCKDLAYMWLSPLLLTHLHMKKHLPAFLQLTTTKDNVWLFQSVNTCEHSSSASLPIKLQFVIFTLLFAFGLGSEPRRRWQWDFLFTAASSLYAKLTGTGVQYRHGSCIRLIVIMTAKIAQKNTSQNVKEWNVNVSMTWCRAGVSLEAVQTVHFWRGCKTKGRQSLNKLNWRRRWRLLIPHCINNTPLSLNNLHHHPLIRQYWRIITSLLSWHFTDKDFSNKKTQRANEKSPGRAAVRILRHEQCRGKKRVSNKSYMFSVLSMSHALLHWPFAFLWRATLSLSICSRSFFHLRYSSCSSFSVGMLRSVLACRLSGSCMDTTHVHVLW